MHCRNFLLVAFCDVLSKLTADLIVLVRNITLTNEIVSERIYVQFDVIISLYLVDPEVLFGERYTHDRVSEMIYTYLISRQ
jgi:hypothetical protein